MQPTRDYLFISCRAQIARAADGQRWTCCPMRYPLIALLALLMLNSIGFSEDAQRPREPSIEGKRLSVWLDQYQKSIPRPEYDGDPQMRARAEQAVRKLGISSMPWLLVELKAIEATRGDELPENFYSGSAIGRRWLAATAFKILGPSARDATPRLILLLDDKQTSYTATTVLGGIGVESIPVLTKALTNSHACARESAARVLGLFGAKAQTAVPALVRCTKDDDASVRSFAAFALKQVDPQAAAKAGVK